MVQAANVCFAAGQVGYRRLSGQLPAALPAHGVFGWFYLGALIPSAGAFVVFGDIGRLPSGALHWGVLVWLGVVASGLGYFLWNRGATRVDAGTLAAMNNALVPAGLLVNLLIWNRDADLLRLAAGGAIIVAALWFGVRHARSRSDAHSPAS